jgi:hypothetical protein
VAYTDAAQDRITAASRTDFANAVEAVRAGTIFARNQKAHDRWQSDVARRSGERQQGRPLAELARDLGAANGGQVVRGEFEFRN